MTTIELRKIKYQGDTCYAWVDPMGKTWRIYKSFSLWRYIREDHDISSLGYLTRDDAVKVLERAFVE